MDPFEDSMKLQEMIDSDMQSNMEFAIPDDGSMDGPTLTDLAPAVPVVVPLDSLIDNQLDVEMATTSDVSWLQCSPLFGLGSDFDGPGSLLVNPQTGLPNGLPEPETPVAVITTPLVDNSVLTTNVVDVFPSGENKDSTCVMEDKDMSTVSQEEVVTLSVDPELPVTLSIDSSEESLVNPVMTNPVSPSSSEPITDDVTCVTMLEDTPPGTDESFYDSKEQEMVKTQLNGHPPKTKESKSKQKNKVTVNQEERNSNNPQIPENNTYPKPAFSYSCLIAMALKNSKTGSLPVNEIYNFMIENFPYFKTAPNGWKNSVRHNLSLNKCFEKIDKPPDTNGNQRKGCLWAMNPEKIEKMDEEVLKWSRKDPLAIQRSMANPDKFALLEKGHMKDNKPIAEESKNTLVKATLNNNNQQEGKKHLSEESDRSMLLSQAKSEANMVNVEGGLSLDSSLGELELQLLGSTTPEILTVLQFPDIFHTDGSYTLKGLWEELDDDRLQFLGENISNSSTHHSAAVISDPLSFAVSKIAENDPQEEEDVVGVECKDLGLCITADSDAMEQGDILFSKHCIAEDVLSPQSIAS